MLGQIIQVLLFFLQLIFHGHLIQLFNDGILDIKINVLNTDFRNYFRFAKRVYIPLPGVKERAAMFKIQFSAQTHHEIKDQDWMQFAEQCE